MVVWEDYRNDNWDIYGLNLSTQEEFQITAGSHSEVHPAVYGTIVVWISREDEHDYVCGYNLLTKEEFQITSESGKPELPAIYGSFVVWYDFRNGNADIYGHVLPPSIFQSQGKPLEEEKREEDENGGVCLGTVLIILPLMYLPAYLRKKQIK